MLSIIFWILLLGVFGRLAVFSFKFSWTVMKIVLKVVLLPLALIGLVLWGLVKIALPILIIVGILSLIFGKKGVA